MSKDLNLCQFIGRLGRDIELKYTASGSAVANFSIACNDDYKDQSGQKVERTNWVNIVMFGKLAEIAAQYLKKGAQVYIRGKQQTRKWQDTQTGQDRYTTEIIAEEMQMLGGKNENSTSPHDSTDYRKASQGSAAPNDYGMKPPADDGFDDVPF